VTDYNVKTAEKWLTISKVESYLYELESPKTFLGALNAQVSRQGVVLAIEQNPTYAYDGGTTI
jgi:hypothetical protein